MNRAYAILHVKSVDEDQRVITGTATTPTPDRDGDIIEPLGATFKNPLPLLLHHDAKKPVGRVTFKKPTKDGIDFKAELPLITDIGALKDRVDEAWQSVKAGLLAGVSIGFRSIEKAFMEGGGIHFLKTELLELSLVTVPANASATIASIKSIDLAASGRHSPGVSGSHPVVRVQKGAPKMANTIQEQIAAFENTRAAKAAAMMDIQTKAKDEGRTKDDAERESFDTLNREITSIDAELKDLRDMERVNLKAATPITAGNPQQASEQRGGNPVITVRPNVPKGTAFVRFAMAKAWAKGDSFRELEYAKQFESTTPEVLLMLKAASAAGSTTDATWAGPLAVAQPSTTEFLELLRPATLLGKMSGFRNVPFNVSVPSQTAGGTYTWVGQGVGKPVGTLAFATVTLGIAKAAGIIVITEELARISTPSAEAVIRNDMISGMAQYLDTQFIDPSVAAVTNVSPGSVTNGTTPITTAGTSPDNARTDLKALVAAFVAANQSTTNAFFVMSEANGFALGSSLNALGQPLFPGIGAKGGSILTIPTVTSQVAGTTVALVDAQGVLMADEGGVNIDASREASVQMDSAPDNPATATTVMVSLWQANLLGFKVERFINWKRARTSAVKYVVATYV